VTVIAITGVGGMVGRRLVEALDQDPAVTRIIGIDRRMPEGLSSPKLHFRVGDVRDERIAEALVGAEVLVHLAFRVDPIHDASAMRAVNVDGASAVFEAALSAGVEHLVYPSSVLVYGAHPDNDVPLTESSELRGIPNFPYAEHKLDVERWLAPWIEHHPELAVTVLRFGALLGPGVDNFITRSFEAPRIPTLRGHRPPLQFLHPADAVSAMQHVIRERLTGYYNVCADGWLSFDEVTAIIGRGTIEVPEEVAYGTVDRMWTLGLGEQPPGVLALFTHPWVMSAQKLAATGWRPRHSNRDAVATMAAEHSDYLTVGSLRVRRGDLRRLGVLALAGVALGVWRWRRSRRRD
jgi:nucleoside-diphosphate-sugar epimerase